MTQSLTLSIRNRVRQQRQSLSNSAQRLAARELAMQARHCTPILRAERIASYKAFNGEISPDSIATPASKVSLLPRIDNYTTRVMHFYASNRCRKNRWGIIEPIADTPPTPIQGIDVILIPLVAFDRTGNRVGMGAGFYDRALQSLRHRAFTRPFLIGVGHHFQEVNSLQPQAWDIALDAILTDREYIVVR